MKRIKCIIVDDEPFAVKLLEGYVKKTSFLMLEGSFNSAIEAKKFLEENEINLIFLDIQMPDLNGLEFATALNPETKVIFTTAFSEYALDSYKVSALDYLLKPFNYDEFFKASLKANEWFTLTNSKQNPKSEPEVFVKSGYNRVRIKLSEIIYCKGFKDYIKIYLTSSSSPILTLMTMKALTEMLPSDNFMRVHRSYIVALDKINSAGKYEINIKGNKVPISESYKQEFQDFMENKSINNL